MGDELVDAMTGIVSEGMVRVQAQVLIAIALLMRRGVEFTPETLERTAANMLAKVGPEE